MKREAVTELVAEQLAQLARLEQQCDIQRRIIESHHERMRHQSEMLQRVIMAAYHLTKFAEERGLSDETLVERMRRELDYQGFCFNCKSLHCECGDDG